MSEKPVMLKIQNIEKRYMIKKFEEAPKNRKEKMLRSFKQFFSPSSGKEPFYALKGVSFEVTQGEKVGIIGKNGAGKSTLLKIISRITEPSDGRIEMLGKIASMLEVGTGFNRELTGRENVYLNGAILGMTRAEVDEKFNDILEFSEVGKFIDTPVKRYSSGMFVRLAFAVASHLDPDILLVDEVLAVGDTRFQKKCIDRMKEIAESGKTILFVSHQMNTIRQLCDRVIVLKEGEIVYDGDVEDGIRLYNDESMAEKSNHFDFTDYKRKYSRRREEADLLSLDVIDNTSCIYADNEPIKIRIHGCTKVENIGDLSIRLTFVKEDETPVSTFFSKPFANIKDIREFDADIIIHKHQLSPGIYKAFLTLCGSTSRKFCYDDFDDIYPAFVFEVLNHDGTHKSWAQLWGKSELDNIEINLL